jgi:hypothetical protein
VALTSGRYRNCPLRYNQVEKAKRVFNKMSQAADEEEMTKMRRRVDETTRAKLTNQSI